MELKGVERVQDVFPISGMGNWIMVPLNVTGIAGGRTHLRGKMMHIKCRTQTLTNVN